MQYVALSNIQHNGEMITPGQLVELTDSEAEPLLMDAAIPLTL